MTACIFSPTQLPKCNQFHSPFSVLVMDNAKIHHGGQHYRAMQPFWWISSLPLIGFHWLYLGVENSQRDPWETLNDRGKILTRIRRRKKLDELWDYERGRGREERERERLDLGRWLWFERERLYSGYLLRGCPNMVSKRVSRSRRLTLAPHLKKKREFESEN